MTQWAAALGVPDLLELDDRHPSVDELTALVERADVVLLPCHSREQVASGCSSMLAGATRSWAIPTRSLSKSSVASGPA